MPILPLVDLFILLGTGSFAIGVLLKVVDIATAYHPTLLGFSASDFALITAVCFAFALTLVARTWLKLNEPRLLARMVPNLTDPQVVAVQPDPLSPFSTVTMCSRAGYTQGTARVGGTWRLGATTRLADVDSDQRPDLVSFYGNGVKVAYNLSGPEGYFFLDSPAQALTPVVQGATAAWVLDVNSGSQAHSFSNSPSARSRAKR